MNSQAQTEQEFAHHLLEEYRGEGFQPVDPALLRQELPLGYTPDLVLRRGDQVVVIEIKSQSEHRALEQIRMIKQTIESIPNWEFKFYVVPRTKESDILEDNLKDIEKLIRRARQLSRNAEFETASVVLWMAIEVALRALLTNRQSRPNLGVSGMSMARSLLGLGEISQDDLQLIDHAWRTRNLAVHGFRLAPREPISPAVVTLAETLAARAKAEASLNR